MWHGISALASAKKTTKAVKSLQVVIFSNTLVKCLACISVLVLTWYFRRRARNVFIFAESIYATCTYNLLYRKRAYSVLCLFSAGLFRFSYYLLLSRSRKMETETSVLDFQSRAAVDSIVKRTFMECITEKTVRCRPIIITLL